MPTPPAETLSTAARASSGIAPLLQPERVPFRPRRTLAALRRTLVVAPHPDDESLGCGGLLALLARREQSAHVLFVTDGTGSHRQSRAFPPERLRQVREREGRRALRRLGLPPGRATFLRLPDEHVPAPGRAAFYNARVRLERFLLQHRPQTLVLPWRRDPHGDHRATWPLLCAAARVLPAAPRLLEYPLWAWVRPRPADHPRPGEAHPWRLDIDDVLAPKKRAIAAHRSQTTSLIHDDPGGFRLTPALRAHFERPWELYLESRLAPPSLTTTLPRKRASLLKREPSKKVVPANAAPADPPPSANGSPSP